MTLCQVIQKLAGGVVNKAECSYRRIGDEDLILTSNNKIKQFLDELKEGEEYVVRYEKASSYDTWRMQKYYRGGVLPSFVPAYFKTANDAHEYFAKKFLGRTDIVDMSDPDKDKKIHRIMNDVSQSIRPTMKEIIVYSEEKIKTVRLRIDWVKSTAALTTRAFTNYIKEIIREGAEHGIEILDGKEWLRKQRVNK